MCAQKIDALKKKKRIARTRLLKVYYKFRINLYGTKIVPEIRLCGQWLEKFGFKDGDDIEVSIVRNRIKIRRLT